MFLKEFEAGQVYKRTTHELRFYKEKQNEKLFVVERETFLLLLSKKSCLSFEESKFSFLVLTKEHAGKIGSNIFSIYTDYFFELVNENSNHDET